MTKTSTWESAVTAGIIALSALANLALVSATRLHPNENIPTARDRSSSEGDIPTARDRSSSEGVVETGPAFSCDNGTCKADAAGPFKSLRSCEWNCVRVEDVDNPSVRRRGTPTPLPNGSRPQTLPGLEAEKERARSWSSRRRRTTTPRLAS